MIPWLYKVRKLSIWLDVHRFGFSLRSLNILGDARTPSGAGEAPKPDTGCLGKGNLESTTATTDSIAPAAEAAGRLLALDLGAKRVGVAVSDELRITVSPLPAIERRSWKDLLRRVARIVEGYEARGLVIGLPLSLDGGEGSAAQEVRTVAEKFRLSLVIPVYLQDERLTTVAAASDLRSALRSEDEVAAEVDSAAAALILRDFIVSNNGPNAGEA